MSIWGKQASCIKRTKILTQVHAGKTLMIPRYWHPQKSIMTFDQKKNLLTFECYSVLIFKLNSSYLVLGLGNAYKDM